MNYSLHLFMFHIKNCVKTILNIFLKDFFQFEEQIIINLYFSFNFFLFILICLLIYCNVLHDVKNPEIGSEKNKIIITKKKKKNSCKKWILFFNIISFKSNRIIPTVLCNSGKKF